MHIFYSELYEAGEFKLDQAESNHLAKVLRLKNGDTVSVINGDGNLYICSIFKADSRSAELKVTEIKRDFDRRNYYLHIAIAPTKSLERFETFVEKAVELGIDEITPLVTSRSERHNLRIDRINKIIVSAMKQSQKSKITIINDLTDLNKFTGKKYDGQLFIAHCIDGIERDFLGKACMPGGKVTVMIGPEGDFNKDEVENAISCGYKSISLGSSRLRTETAGITSCSQVYLINQLSIS